MTNAALRIILVGSTLLLSAEYSFSAGQEASPAPTVTRPAKDSPTGKHASLGLDEQTSPSTAVVQAETLYADVADSFGIISTIDSGLFATYREKDHGAWVQVYSEKRKQLSDKLSRISASVLSPLDARALNVMNRHLCPSSKASSSVTILWVGKRVRQLETA